MNNEEAVKILESIKTDLYDSGVDENNIIFGKDIKAINFAIKVLKERPKGEYEFIEILAQYVPDDICTYPEYKGKPYYSIHYKQNGEEFVGFGTYNPEVLSRYLKEYFMKGCAE